MLSLAYSLRVEYNKNIIIIIIIIIISDSIRVNSVLGQVFDELCGSGEEDNFGLASCVQYVDLCQELWIPYSVIEFYKDQNDTILSLFTSHE